MDERTIFSLRLMVQSYYGCTISAEQLSALELREIGLALRCVARDPEEDDEQTTLIVVDYDAGMAPEEEVDYISWVEIHEPGEALLLSEQEEGWFRRALRWN